METTPSEAELLNHAAAEYVKVLETITATLMKPRGPKVPARVTAANIVADLARYGYIWTKIKASA